MQVVTGVRLCLAGVLAVLAVLGRARRLKVGQKVLVWYDPADPSDMLVYGQLVPREN